jgi:hypothetical protein
MRTKSLFYFMLKSWQSWKKFFSSWFVDDTQQPAYLVNECLLVVSSDFVYYSKFDCLEMRKSHQYDNVMIENLGTFDMSPNIIVLVDLVCILSVNLRCLVEFVMHIKSVFGCDDLVFFLMKYHSNGWVSGISITLLCINLPVLGWEYFPSMDWFTIHPSVSTGNLHNRFSISSYWNIILIIVSMVDFLCEINYQTLWW